MLYLIFGPRGYSLHAVEARLSGGLGVALMVVMIAFTLHALRRERSEPRTLAELAIEPYPGAQYSYVPSGAEVHGLRAVMEGFRGDTAAANRSLDQARTAAGGEPRTWMAESKDSVSTVARFYRAAAERGGWVPVPQLSVDEPDVAHLGFTRGAQKLSIAMLSRPDGTRILYTLDQVR